MVFEVHIKGLAVLDEGSIGAARFLGNQALHTAAAKARLALASGFSADLLQKRLGVARIEQFKRVVHPLNIAASAGMTSGLRVEG